MLAAWCAAVWSCDGGENRVRPKEPPSHWVERIRQERAAKDVLFANPTETPVPSRDLPSFRGLQYWPPDPAYHLVGPLQRHERPQRFTIVTTSGQERPCERYGHLDLVVGGRACRLQVYRLLDQAIVPGAQGLFVPFTDGTTGGETYPAGRYVDLGEQDGEVVLDFNRAYNPLCAYGAPERYRCPVTPRENRLPVRIEAGERGYRHAGASRQP